MVMQAICEFSRIIPGRGVAALLEDGTQVAVFRLADDSLHAVSNLDPFMDANVMSRGLVGDRGGEPIVTSPLLKQAFSLKTGACLDDETAALEVFAVEVVDGLVRVGAASPTATRTGVNPVFTDVRASA